MLREKLANSLLGEKLLHECCLLYVLTLNLLDLKHLAGLLLSELLEGLWFYPVASKGGNDAFVVVLSGLFSGFAWTRMSELVRDLWVWQTVEVLVFSWLHKFVAVVVLLWLRSKFVFFSCLLLPILALQYFSDICFNTIDSFFHSFGLIEIFPFDCPCD